MGIVAILAMFAGEAGNGGGAAFAITYAAFLAVMTWLWYTVRRQDVIQRPELLVDTGRYVVAMAVSVAVMAFSAFLTADTRLLGWAALVAGWMVVPVLMGRSRIGLSRGVTPTDSLVDGSGPSRSLFWARSSLASSMHSRLPITTSGRSQRA